MFSNLCMTSFFILIITIGLIKIMPEDVSENVKMIGGGWTLIWFLVWVISTIGVIWS